MNQDLNRHKVDNSRLLPELRRMLAMADTLGATPVEQQTPAEARASSELRIAGQWGDKDDVDDIEDLIIPSGDAAIPARLYRSAGAANTVLYFHGGGWVVGSIATHDGMLRAMTRASGANILSVEYRKAPEAPFPLGLNDAEAALDWLDAHGKKLELGTERLIVMGDSAGASLAAALTVRARNRSRPLFGEALIYPATDLAHATPSRAAFAYGFGLQKPSLDWFLAQYCAGGALADNPEMSPLLMGDLTNLPPTLLITADHDPLRDEGRAYAQRLIGAGNDVAYVEWQGVVHGFLMMDRFTVAARSAVGRVADWCNSLWGR